MEMELLASYSSDDSNDLSSTETEAVPVSKASPTPTDYFNLENAGNDRDPPENKLLDSYELVTESQRLSTVSYGPSRSNDEPSKSTAKEEDELHKRSNKRHYETHSPTGKMPKLEFRDDAEAEYFDNPHPQSTFENPSDGIDVTRETVIYYEDLNISARLDEELYSYIPKHQKITYHGHQSAVSSLKWCAAQYSYLLLSSSLDSSVKVWDINRNKHVLKATDSKGIRSATWSTSGTEIFYGGFSKKLVVIDVNTGKDLMVCDIKDYISSILPHPELPNIILVGTKNKILALDKNASGLPVRTFASRCQYILDMAFIDNDELLSSTEVVSHDSSDRTLMVWDFATGSILSNQIYSERYTCPSVAVAPDGKHFIAQSNGDYMVMFSTKRPYKMLNRRYVGHKVSGYSIGCDYSADGKYLVSGDAEGSVCVYSSWNSKLVEKLIVTPEVPTLRAAWHPLLPSTIAIACWNGSMHVWK